MYDIYFDFRDDDGTEHVNATKVFEGNLRDVKIHVRTMRKRGCYNITAIKRAA